MWTTAGFFVASCLVIVAGNTCPQTVASICGTPLARGLSANDQAIIVDEHNNLRSRIAQGQETRGNPGPQPPASNMQEMYWDDELAYLAQSWADQCTYAHNLCGGSERFQVGQNVFTMNSSRTNEPMDFSDAVDTWYNEVDLFDPASITPFTLDHATGHYTQVVWSTSELVGCGYIEYQDPSGGDEYWYMLVCNYGPAGNIDGGSVYNTSGSACSSCPSSAECGVYYPDVCR